MTTNLPTLRMASGSPVLKKMWFPKRRPNDARGVSDVHNRVHEAAEGGMARKSVDNV